MGCNVSRVAPIKSKVVYEDHHAIRLPMVDSNIVTSFKKLDDPSFTQDRREKALNDLKSWIDDAMRIFNPSSHKTSKTEGNYTENQENLDPVLTIITQDLKNKKTYNYFTYHHKREAAELDTETVERVRAIIDKVVLSISNKFRYSRFSSELMEFFDYLIHGKIYPGELLSVYEIMRLNFTPEYKIGPTTVYQEQMIIVYSIFIRGIAFGFFMNHDIFHEFPTLDKEEKKFLEKNLSIIGCIIFECARSLLIEECPILNKQINKLLINPYDESHYKHEFDDISDNVKFYFIFQQNPDWAINLKRRILVITQDFFEAISPDRVKEIKKKRAEKLDVKRRVSQELDLSLHSLLKSTSIRSIDQNELEKAFQALSQWVSSSMITQKNGATVHSSCLLLHPILKKKAIVDLKQKEQVVEGLGDIIAKVFTIAIDFIDQLNTRIESYKLDDSSQETLSYFIFGKTNMKEQLSTFEIQRLNWTDKGELVDPTNQQLIMILIFRIIFDSLITNHICSALRSKDYWKKINLEISDVSQETLDSNLKILATIVARIAVTFIEGKCPVLQSDTKNLNITSKQPKHIFSKSESLKVESFGLPVSGLLNEEDYKDSMISHKDELDFGMQNLETVGKKLLEKFTSDFLVRSGDKNKMSPLSTQQNLS